jgi:hypothetical protein
VNGRDLEKEFIIYSFLLLLKACLNENMDETQVRRIVNLCKLIGDSTDKSYYQKNTKRCA